MDEEDGERPLQPPRRLLEPEQRLQRTRDESRLSIQKEEGNHADEWRQHHRQRNQRAQRPAAGEIEPLEEKGEGNPNRCCECDARKGDPHTRPQRGPFAGACEELAPGAWTVRGFEHDDQNRVHDQPGEQERHRQPCRIHVANAIHRRPASSGRAITRVAST